jgi:hypothetical protein
LRAEVENDTGALGRMLDDHFIATFSSGRTIDKTQFIALFDGTGSQTMHSCDLTDRQAIIDAGTAVIVDTATMRGTRNGEPYAATARVTATYIKRGGEWRILAEHLSALPSAS